MDRRKFLAAGAAGAAAVVTVPTLLSPAGAVAPDIGVRYVAVGGNDGNDGLSWETAKASVSAAAWSLPMTAFGSSTLPIGHVKIGAGIFYDQSLPYSTYISYQGVGSGSGWGRGTEVKLQNGATDHLFRPEPGFTGYGHHLKISDMTVHGNKGNQTGDWDCVRIRRGGFNCSLDNVVVRDASRTGIYVDGAGLNLRLNEVHGAYNETHMLHIDGAPSALGSVLWTGGSVDNCGVTPVLIDPGGAMNIDVKLIQFDGVKFEATGGDHQTCIWVKPAPYATARFVFRGVWGRNYPAGNETAIVYEENKPGKPGSFLLEQVIVDDAFPSAFKSDKTGVEHAGAAVLETF